MAIEEAPSRLTDECGHHCGVAPMGRGTHVGHCEKECCHNYRDIPESPYDKAKREAAQD